MRVAHLILIPMTSVGIGRAARVPGWLDARIDIFKKYTLASLLNQTDRDFILWLALRPQDIYDHRFVELACHLDSVGMRHVYTFDWLPYWDDKFSRGILQRAANCARIVRDAFRSRNWSGLVGDCLRLLENRNGTLNARLEKMLQTLRERLPGSDWVYLTRIDSDDVFHREEIASIKEAGPFEGAYVHRKGWAYNAGTGELALWNPDTNPPFHTICFRSVVFWNPFRHVSYYNGFKSHEDVDRVFETRKLADGRYCVVLHNPRHHISSVWNHPFRGQVVGGAERDRILTEFGIK